MRTASIYISGLIGLLFFPAPVGAAESHCQMQEQVIFSCSVGKKTVSVCASKDFSAHSGYLQYRFGPLGMPELTFPALNASDPVTQFIQARTWMFAGGGGGYLRFINGQYHYIVYTAIGKGWGAKDGVAVERNHQVIANLECQNVPISKISDDFFTRAGLQVDQNEFEIPGLD
ncbi:hypothetical protein [Nitrosomonas ureae]|uniref:Uncharacterized protein n=1 Tax=Nitrosomonas ureae TaxID=44577 RepID=A0A1H5UZB9_9PROT|nr:hypothetical protein [Nitrosomonas ureae]SEF80314.1 hypothetical protein SAMN05216334_11032 [Nitrosomonas ureae]